jgi:hypothetical protein
MRLPGGDTAGPISSSSPPTKPGCRTRPTTPLTSPFTLSVLDHLPRLDAVAPHLVRVTAGYLVLAEIAHDRMGKVVQMTTAAGDLVDGYPFSPSGRKALVRVRGLCQRLREQAVHGSYLLRP